MQEEKSLVVSVIVLFILTAIISSTGFYFYHLYKENIKELAQQKEFALNKFGEIEQEVLNLKERFNGFEVKIDANLNSAQERLKETLVKIDMTTGELEGIKKETMQWQRDYIKALSDLYERMKAIDDGISQINKRIDDMGNARAEESKNK